VTNAPVLTSGEAAVEAERVVAWLRLPAIGLLALSQSLQHPNPHERGFLFALVLFSAWSAAMLAWVYLRTPGPRLALTATGVDIAAISVLAVLSGGAFSHARLAFFLVPVTVAFRFRPSTTAVAAIVTTSAYVLQAVAHPAFRQPQAVRFVLTQAGFLAWVGLACVLLSALLARRTAQATRLAESRSQLRLGGLRRQPDRHGREAQNGAPGDDHQIVLPIHVVPVAERPQVNRTVSPVSERSASTVQTASSVDQAARTTRWLNRMCRSTP